MKRRAVLYATAASGDLDWIYDTIAEASESLVTASRYEQRIREFCESLDTASERGTRRDDGIRIIGFERRVTVAFVVNDESVVILRIFYGGADWGRAL